MKIRAYRAEDYDSLKALYLHGDLYGGQFDAARDSREKLSAVTSRDPDSILVCEDEGKIRGTVSLIDDGRVAILFRFAVEKSPDEKTIARSLYDAARDILASRGHAQVLVYAPADDPALAARYTGLGLNRGNAYTCFWQDL